MVRRERRIAACAGAAAVLLTCGVAQALETDQWSVPDQPLADVGPMIGAYVWQRLELIVDDTNARLLDEQHKADISTTKLGREYRLRQVRELSTIDHVAHELYLALGHGFPESNVELEAKQLAGAMAAQPALFDTAFADSVMASTSLARPLNSVAVLPTMNMHGHYMGTEKLGHFFQQGFEYFKKYRKHEAKGKRHARCLKKAVDVGVKQESGIYGYIPSGTYSNADLAANYAGLKWYLNLARAVRIGDRTLPALLVFEDNQWRVNPEAADREGELFLSDFFSEHFSESFNPPRYDWTIRGGIRDAIVERADRWVQFHQTNREAETERLRRVETWFGEDYGHSGWADVVTILDVYAQD